MTVAFRTTLLLTLVITGIISTAEGSRIYLKAILAQYLLETAWRNIQNGVHKLRPWPWADTWPVAELSSPHHNERMIVLAGATGRTLAFGPAHLLASADPGEIGNTVLLGHRDTHFAFLKHLQPNDLLQLKSTDGTQHFYRVSETTVVHESKVDVMAPSNDKRLTLITCFPFDALIPGGPLRYVVHAIASE